MSASSQGDARREELAGVLERNIAVLIDRRREEERTQRRRDRIATRIGRFSGSMTFVVIHLVIVVLWVAANVGMLPGVPRFDADFVKLATAASVEAIFLSTFVLVMQNRMAAVAIWPSDNVLPFVFSMPLITTPGHACATWKRIQYSPEPPARIPSYSSGIAWAAM
jgi:uncharacterized membrane protein